MGRLDGTPISGGTSFPPERTTNVTGRRTSADWTSLVRVEVPVVTVCVCDVGAEEVVLAVAELVVVVLFDAVAAVLELLLEPPQPAIHTAAGTSRARGRNTDASLDSLLIEPHQPVVVARLRVVQDPAGHLDGQTF